MKTLEFKSHQLRNFFRRLILNYKKTYVTLTRTPSDPWIIQRAIPSSKADYFTILNCYRTNDPINNS